ncbi:MAG: TIGR04282 family arsenosugar biosynthesis glycosyltransferase [Mariniblastus sp.]
MNHLGLFAKFWQPGTVKTRLAVSIGETAACKLYQAFVFHLLKQLTDTADTRSVAFSPTNKESNFRQAISTDWNLRPQSSGDLGARMRSFFDSQFQAMNSVKNDPNDSQVQKIVVIGADCPQLSPSVINSAFDLLNDAPVVLGPSADGGYYLIAMRDRTSNIFDGVTWSTEHVLNQTIEQLDAKNISFSLLPELTDVDEIESLIVLKKNLITRDMNSGLNKDDAQLLAQINEAVQANKATDEVDHAN